MVHAEGPAEGIETARRASTLVKAIGRSSIDADIVADVADACEIKEYTIMHLADTDLTVETLSQDLYLTVEEAARVQEVCRAEVERLGLQILPGGELPSPIDEEENPPPPEEDAAPEDIAGNLEEQAEAVPDVIAVTGAEEIEDAAEPEAEPEPVASPEPVPENGTVERAPESPAVEKTATPLDSGAPTPPPVSSAETTPESYPTPVTPTPVKANPTEQETPCSSTPAVPAPTPVAASQSGSAERPVSASPAGANHPVTGQARPPASPMTRPTSAPPKSAGQPSYARPTAAALKKVKEEGADEAASMKARPASASVRVSSSLLRQTAASKAWSAGNSEKVRSRLTGSTSDLNASMSDLHKGPTQPKPFNLRTNSAKKANSMTTDEMQIAKAKSDMQALNEKRARLAKYGSAPPKVRPASENRTPTQFKPFSLSSLSLHERAATMRQMQLEEEAKKEAQSRHFRARPVQYNKGKTYSDVLTSVEERMARQKKHTVGSAPVLSSQERSKVHRKIEEEKRAKEAEQAALLAAEQLEKERQEEAEMKAMRKTLQFHAQAMPNFSEPFKPDLTQAAQPTVAITPRFQTEQRAGIHSTGHSESTLDTVVPIADNFNFFASTLRGDAKAAEKSASKSHGKGKSSAKILDVKVDVTAN